MRKAIIVAGVGALALLSLACASEWNTQPTETPVPSPTPTRVHAAPSFEEFPDFCQRLDRTIEHWNNLSEQERAKFGHDKLMEFILARGRDYGWMRHETAKMVGLCGHYLENIER